MDISIIINNYKTRGLLKQCLKGILSNPPRHSFEIIVVDNNSGDGSVELVREMFASSSNNFNPPPKKELPEARADLEILTPNVKLISSRLNLGHHRGNNLGIKNSSGRYVLILNTDIVSFDDVFDRLYDFLEANPKVALVGPKLKNPDGSIQASCMRFPKILTPFYRRTFLSRFEVAEKELNRYLMSDFKHDQTRSVDWILGACEMIRRSAIDRVGMMDENLFLYFGDVAWCKKFWRAGWAVYYFAEGDIIHYHRRESAESGLFSRIFWIHIIDWIRYLLKYYK